MREENHGRHRYDQELRSQVLVHVFGFLAKPALT